MTARFYFANAAAPYTPATKHGTWNDSSASVTGLLGQTPAGAATTAAASESNTTNNYKVLLGRWISAGAVKAGTIAGVITYCHGALESASGANDSTQIHIWVTQGDSDTERGVLLSNRTSAAGTWATTATSTAEGDLAVSNSVTISVGDRIVVELGYNAANTSATTFTGTINYGNTGNPDIYPSATNVTTRPGWIEFSGADGLFFPTAVFGDKGDAFDAGSTINPQWATFGTVSQASGLLSLTTTNASSGVFLVRGFNLNNSRAYAKVVAAPKGTETGSSYSGIFLYRPFDGATGATDIYIAPDAVTGLLVFGKTDNNTDASTNITYSATTHAWLGLREAAGTLYWETSTDGRNWTTQRSLATPTWITQESQEIDLDLLRSNGDSQTATFDNFNIGLGPPNLIARQAVKRAAFY